MTGSMSYPDKVKTLFVSKDNVLGLDAETGLANMQAVAEK
jgi:hypothetical protein